MELEECTRCERPICAGDCVLWIDGVAHSISELVSRWGIQARQVREHLANGTHPRCADGSIVRRVTDGERLRPCDVRGVMTIQIEAQGRSDWVSGLSRAAEALGVPRSSLHKLIQDPGRPVPAGWRCDALGTEYGWHFRAAYK